MGRAMVTRLGLGLLLLALLLPTQIYSQTTSSSVPSVATTNSTLSTPAAAASTSTSSSASASTSTSASASASVSTSSTKATNGSDSVLQSISCLFIILFSLLHLYC